MLLKKIRSLVYRNRRSFSYIALCVLLGGGAYAGYKKWESNWYRSLMPSEVEVGRTLLIEGKSDLRSGCGVAIFQLTPHMREQISMHGLAAFDVLLRHKSGANVKHETHTWESTPYVETGDGMTLEDRWVVGLTCVENNPDVVRKIYAALRRPGSFVKKLDNAAVVVVPASGLAAFVYFG